MLVFSSARAAVDAMVETQRALHTWARSQPTSAVRVRVGMHTGEVLRQNDELATGRRRVPDDTSGCLAAAARDSARRTSTHRPET
jgi:hypothetical protein